MERGLSGTVSIFQDQINRFIDSFCCISSIIHFLFSITSFVFNIEVEIFITIHVSINILPSCDSLQQQHVLAGSVKAVVKFQFICLDFAFIKFAITFLYIVTKFTYLERIYHLQKWKMATTQYFTFANQNHIITRCEEINHAMLPRIHMEDTRDITNPCILVMAKVSIRIR